jgi:hypothetical protein
MMTLLNIWWSGALLAALACLYENYKYAGKISIGKIDIILILLSWVTVIFWLWSNFQKK